MRLEQMSHIQLWQQLIDKNMAQGVPWILWLGLRLIGKVRTLEASVSDVH